MSKKMKLTIEQSQFDGVMKIKDSRGPGIFMMVDGFQTDAEAKLLRDYLWFARNNGVVVTMVPSETDESEKCEVKIVPDATESGMIVVELDKK